MCSTLASSKYFSSVSICKYLLTVGLWEQTINVMQSWPGVLKFSRGGGGLHGTNPPSFRASLLYYFLTGNSTSQA